MRLCNQILVYFLFLGTISCASSNSKTLTGTNSGDDLETDPLIEIVFLIGEREYNTKNTLPVFAEKNFPADQYKLIFLHADSLDKNSFPGIEALNTADLLVLSVRRRTLPTSQFSILNDYIWSDKPIVGIRTASHGFELRNEVAPEGHQQFKNFDRIVLGGDYEGHYGKKLVSTVLFDKDFLDHPVLDGIPDQEYTSISSLYRARDLEDKTEAIIWAKIVEEGKLKREPVAWTNTRGNQRIFYTSLGHESDFTQEYFQTFLRNGMMWTLNL